MNNIKYVQATESDLKIMTELRIEFLKKLPGVLSQDAEHKLKINLENYFQSALRSGNYICWIAINEQIPVGIGGLVIREQPGNFKNPSGKVGYILSMYTKAAYRKQGIGSSILNLLIDSAKKIGITSFELHATKDGGPVYLKNGFEVHPEPTFRKHITKY